MFQLVTETFCHFILALNDNFLTLFIQCLYRYFLRTNCFSTTSGEAKASLHTFLCAAFFNNYRIDKFENHITIVDYDQSSQNTHLVRCKSCTVFCCV